MSRLYHLRKAKKYIDKKLAIRIYKQMILPTFEYGGFIIDGAALGDMRCFQTIQNSCLRCCCGIRNPRDISRHLLHVACRCEFLLVRRNKCLLGILYTLSRNPDNVVVPVRDLRGNAKVKLKVSRSKLGLYDKSPLYRGNILWNALDPALQHSATKRIFLDQI